jgi:hypothetical protein
MEELYAKDLPLGSKLRERERDVLLRIKFDVGPTCSRVRIVISGLYRDCTNSCAIDRGEL